MATNDGDEIAAIRIAILEGAPGEELADLPLPATARGALVKADEQEMFAGLPSEHDDSMMATNQRIWGFETNFGGLADVAVVKANQLMPKPKHLTWEEAACNALCNSTSYRMIVSKNGSHMTQGQAVLVWGATGGIGAYATQYVLNGGGTPVGVVSSERRAELLRAMGCHAVIDRRAEGYKFWKNDT